MAIFKYKKSNGSGGYSIAEMPVISNTYTEYVVQDATDGTRTITLTPTKTSDSTGPGAFEDVIANVKLLSSNPTYDPMTSLQIITYGSDGFPAGITISAIPTTTKTYTSSGSKQEYNFNTSTGFPTKVTINAMPVSTPPTDLQITTPSETITIPAGYYSSDIIISSNINNRGNIKDQTQIKPSNYSSTYYNTGYYTGGTTNGKVNIATGAITFTANSPNGTPYTYSDWGNVFPTSITVAVPSDLPQVATPPSVTTITTQNGSIKIDAGYYTSDITISASLPTSTVPSDTTISTPSETVTIPAGYLSSAVIINSNIANRGAPGAQSLTPKTKTSYSVYQGYYSSGFTVSPSTQTLTSTNPSLTYNSSTGYYEKSYEPTTSTSSSTVWGNKYLTKFTLQLASSTPSKIVSGQSVCGISGTHVCPSAPSIDVSEIYPQLNSLYDSTTVESLFIPITRWRNNAVRLLDGVKNNSFSEFSESDWVNLPYISHDLNTNYMCDYLNYNGTDGYVSYSGSYSSYMTALDFPSAFQTVIPPYGLAWIDCYYEDVINIGCDSSITYICPYAFWGANIYKLLINGNNRAMIIASRSFAGFRINKAEFHGSFQIAANIFKDISNSDSGMIYQLTINATDNVYIHPQAFSGGYPVWLYIYGSTNINMSDQPWGATNASVYIRS